MKKRPAILLVLLLAACWSVPSITNLITSRRNAVHAPKLRAGVLKKKITRSTESNATVLTTRLVSAIEAGDVAGVKRALNAGADVDRYVLPIASKDALPNGIQTTPLIMAVVYGSTEIIHLILDHGANPDMQDMGNEGVLGRGDTALMWAARHDDIRAMRLLIAHGANVHVTDDWGRNAMFQAMQIHSIPAVKLLTKAGLSLKDRPSQKGMRFVIENTSGRSGNQVRAFLKYLLDCGADANSSGFEEFGDKKTLLMIASGAPHGREGDSYVCPDAVRLLLRYGANPLRRDEDGQTALDFAKGGGLGDEAEYRSVVAMLKVAEMRWRAGRYKSR